MWVRERERERESKIVAKVDSLHIVHFEEDVFSSDSSDARKKKFL